jgi:hypothetical protein
MHERRRSVRRSIAAELDRAHLATQIALPDGLDLHERWQGDHTALRGSKTGANRVPRDSGHSRAMISGLALLHATPVRYAFDIAFGWLILTAGLC